MPNVLKFFELCADAQLHTAIKPEISRFHYALRFSNMAHSIVIMEEINLIKEKCYAAYVVRFVIYNKKFQMDSNTLSLLSICENLLKPCGTRIKLIVGGLGYCAVSPIFLSICL